MSSSESEHRPVALVTGAARRIGRAIALFLAGRGYDVAIHCQRSRSEAAEVAERVALLGSKAAIVSADLSNFAEVERLIPSAVAGLGPLTLLVNNASEFRSDSLLDASPSTWAAHMDVNLKAPVFLTQSFARQLPEGANGNVVNIIDQRVLRLTPDFFSYSVSKVGLWAATRTAAQALAPRIRVNAIGPGPVLRSVHQSDADFAAEMASTLLKRGAAPEEIAAAVGFILDAPAMTGQIIALDSGQHLS